MTSQINKVYVVEVRFNTRAIFHDNFGKLIEVVQGASSLPNWLMQPSQNFVVHDGTPEGDLGPSAERVFVTQNSFAHVILNPESITSYTNRFKTISDAISSNFPGTLEFARYGARSLRLIPSQLNFEDLIERFNQRYGDVSPIGTSLFPQASISDVGFAVNYIEGTAEIRTMCGPVKKEEAIQEQFKGYEKSNALKEWPEIGVFLDVDIFSTKDVPKRLGDIRKLIKGYLDDQEAAAERLQTVFAQETTVAN